MTSVAQPGTRQRYSMAPTRAVQVPSRPMTRFVVDSSAVLHLASAGAAFTTRHELLAPILLRSQTLSALHEAVHRGKLTAAVAREQLARIARIPIRLLGDAVLRRRAWDLADQLAWPSTYDAEYLALTQLQADAFITLDSKLARKARAVVRVASLDELTTSGRRR
jgi:predicted nucleic acid-binding protein